MAISAKLRFKAYPKEFFYALGIFLLPLLIYTHRLLRFSSSGDGVFLGRTFHISPEYLEYIGYTALSNFVPVLLLVLWICTTTKKIAVFIGVPLSLFLWLLFTSMIPQQWSQFNPFLFYAFWISVLLVHLVLHNKEVKSQKLSNSIIASWSIAEIIACTVLFLLPLLMAMVYTVPKYTNSILIWVVRISDYGFKDAATALYHINHKIVILTSLLVWYLIEKRWWRYALISPLIIYSYQIINVLDARQRVTDEYEIWESFPVLVLIALFLAALSKSACLIHRANAIYKKAKLRIEHTVSERHKPETDYIQKIKNDLKDIPKQDPSTEMAYLLKLQKDLEKRLEKDEC